VIHQALEELVEEVDVETANHGAGEDAIEVKPWPTGQVDDDSRERLIQGDIGVSVTPDPALVTERLGQRLAERDANVFDRVVRVDMEITLGLHAEVDQTVPCHLIEHVVEEWHPGVELGPTTAIEIQRDLDAGLERLARDPRLAMKGLEGHWVSSRRWPAMAH
jgi:hypothetical protein